MAGRKQDRRRRERAETAQQAGRATSGPDAPIAADAVSARAFARREAWAILALGLLVAASYWPAALSDFLWDDVILKNSPAVQSWSGLLDIWFAPGDAFPLAHPVESHYWPVTYTSFWIEHKLWGFDPTGYHVVNVLLHLANTILLFRLMQRLAVPGAWFIAAVFAVHPLHVESVAWVIERKDLLSGLFYLAAVLAWLRFEEAPDRRRYVLVLVLFAAGILGKSIVVTLPAALLILAWWKRGEVSFTDLSRVLPLFALGLFIVLVDLSFYWARSPVSFDFSPLERGLLAARLLWFYAGKLLWPVELAVIYPLPAPDLADPAGWGYALGVLVVAGIGWFARHRIGRGPLAGALFFAVTLSPTLGFVDFGYMLYSFAADRFQYLAGIGAIAVAAGAAAHGAGRLSGMSRMGMQALALAVLVVLGTLTWRQAGIYRDEVTFFSHITSFNPQARNAYGHLAKALLRRDRIEESLVAGRKAVALRQDDSEAHNNLGVALHRLDRPDEAQHHYRRSLESNPRNANAAFNLGIARFGEERFDEALELFRRVVQSKPRHAIAWSHQGAALYRLGRYDEALRSFERALSLDPNLESARTGREQVLLKNKKP